MPFKKKENIEIVNEYRIKHYHDWRKNPPTARVVAAAYQLITGYVMKKYSHLSFKDDIPNHAALSWLEGRRPIFCDYELMVFDYLESVENIATRKRDYKKRFSRFSKFVSFDERELMHISHYNTMELKKLSLDWMPDQVVHRIIAILKAEHDFTNVQIGHVLNISEGRVCQLFKKLSELEEIKQLKE